MNKKLEYVALVRLRLFYFGIALLFLVLLVRLFFLQLVSGSHYAELANNNRLRVSSIPAARGQIYDRYGRLLATTESTFSVELLPEADVSMEQLFEFISSTLNLDQKKLEADFIRNNKYRRRHQTKLLLKDISKKQRALLAPRLYYFPHIIIKANATRIYKSGAEMFQVLGYIRQISRAQLTAAKEYYEAGDLIGKIGIEKIHEEQLRGHKGSMGIIVDAAGQKQSNAFIEPALHGERIDLTIDAGLQKVAYEALGENTGAVVAIEPSTGRILSLVSKPAVDPSMFTGELIEASWQKILQDVKRPLSNRAINATYPPGSVFKVFMAIAGLEEEIITPEKKVNCPGYFKVNKARFNCHRRGGHGNLNLEQAIAGSCNVYFYEMGQVLGIDRISSYAHEFGFGEKTHISLSGERAGLVPSREWKKNNFSKDSDKRWYPGETPSVIIGQGAIESTPLQVALATNAVATDGKLFKPLLTIKEEITYRELNYSAESITAVKEGMLAVVNSPRGTAKQARLDKAYNVLVAGKTATAQIRSSKNLKGKDSENHAWFTSFAPYENPEIVLTVIVENGGHGGASAAPVAKEILEYFFQHRLPEENEVKN